MPEPKQQGLDFTQQETENYNGVKHEWTGTLYVPTADETRRIEREAAARDAISPICIAEPQADIVNPLLKYGFNRTRKVKMNFKDALGVRQRGA